MHSFHSHPVFFDKFPGTLHAGFTASFLPLADAVGAGLIEAGEFGNGPVGAILNGCDGFGFHGGKVAEVDSNGNE